MLSNYIAFEGLNKSGKSTQIKKLREEIRSGTRIFGNKRIEFIKEPSDYSLVLGHTEPHLQLMAFTIDRKNIMDSIEEMQDAGSCDVLISDRCFLSTLVYQLPETLLSFSQYECITQPWLLYPDRVYWLNCSYETMLKRHQDESDVTQDKVIVTKEKWDLYNNRYSVLKTNYKFPFEIVEIDANQEADLVFSAIKNDIIKNLGK